MGVGHDNPGDALTGARGGKDRGKMAVKIGAGVDHDQVAAADQPGIGAGAGQW